MNSALEKPEIPWLRTQELEIPTALKTTKLVIINKLKNHHTFIWQASISFLVQKVQATK